MYKNFELFQNYFLILTVLNSILKKYNEIQKYFFKFDLIKKHLQSWLLRFENFLFHLKFSLFFNHTAQTWENSLLKKLNLFIIFTDINLRLFFLKQKRLVILIR